jgi:hypothetical protein
LADKFVEPAISLREQIVHLDLGGGGDSGEASSNSAGRTVVTLAVAYGKDQNLFHTR